MDSLAAVLLFAAGKFNFCILYDFLYQSSRNHKKQTNKKINQVTTLLPIVTGKILREHITNSEGEQSLAMSSYLQLSHS